MNDQKITHSESSGYEPPELEIWLTLGLGLTVLSPYYRGFARSLGLRGSERVLDFGSGSGICTRHIAARLQQGGRLDCVDISRGWMAVLQRRLRRYSNVSYHLGSILDLDLPISNYDIVVSHFVLHDIRLEERSQIFPALAGKLAQGGRMILREPIGEGLSRQELQQLAADSGLVTASLVEKKLLIGQVYDVCFIQPA